MVQYTYVKIIDSSKLTAQIIAAGLDSIHHIDTTGATVLIFFSETLSAPQKAQLDSLVTAHQSSTIDDVIDSRIEDAKAYGAKLMAEYARNNVKAGKSIAQIKDILIRGQLIQSAIMSGSLYVALELIEEVEPSVGITQADIDWFSGKIRAHLGL